MKFTSVQEGNFDNHTLTQKTLHLSPFQASEKYTVTFLHWLYDNIKSNLRASLSMNRLNIMLSAYIHEFSQ